MARPLLRYIRISAHYATVGEALLWTLGAGLGAAFTAAVMEASTAAYGLLARVIQGK